MNKIYLLALITLLGAGSALAQNNNNSSSNTRGSNTGPAGSDAPNYNSTNSPRTDQAQRSLQQRLSDGSDPIRSTPGATPANPSANSNPNANADINTQSNRSTRRSNQSSSNKSRRHSSHDCDDMKTSDAGSARQPSR